MRHLPAPKPAAVQSGSHSGGLCPVTVATTHYKTLIGGRWVDAESGKTFESTSPANHEDVIGSFPASGPADVDAAVAAAKAA